MYREASLPYASVQEIQIIVCEIIRVIALDLNEVGCCGRSARKTLTMTDKLDVLKSDTLQ